MCDAPSSSDIFDQRDLKVRMKCNLLHLLLSGILIYKVVSITNLPSQELPESGPKLVGFLFDYGSGRIQMRFDQIMFGATLNASFICLQSSQYNATNAIHLSGSYNNVSLLPNSTDIDVYLLSNDYYRARLPPLVGADSKSTFLSLLYDTILSAEYGLGNTVYGGKYAAFAVTEYLADTRPPFVTRYSLNMNNGTMTISFSEPIDNSTFHLSGLAFQSVRNDFKLTSSYAKLVDTGFQHTVSGTYQLDVMVQLGSVNLNLIKQLGNLCTNEKNTFLSAWNTFVNDTMGLAVSLSAFDSQNGMSPVSYVRDVTNPSLLMWEFSFNTGVLSLYFSEIVNLASFNYSTIMLTNERIGTNLSSLMHLSPPNSEVPKEILSNIFNITLKASEMNQLKNQPQLMKLMSTSYLILMEGAVNDVAEIANKYLGLDATFSNAMQISFLQQNTIPPRVLTFNVDLTKREISLVFSEIIDVSSFILQSVTLQSAASRYTPSLLLLPSLVNVVTEQNSAVVAMSITKMGVEAILLSGVLCTSQRTCYLSYSADIVRDTCSPPNRARSLDPLSALMADYYVPNYNAPYLVTWGMDLNLGMLYFNFSEPVNATTLMTSSITLASDALSDSSTLFATLSASSYTVSGSVSDVTIRLGASDLLAIQTRPPLCSTAQRCYLNLYGVLGYSVSTYTSNMTAVQEAIQPVQSMLNSVYTQDTTSPKLLSFNISMSNSSLLLSFSEAVKGQDIIISGITLSFRSSTGVTDSVRLTQGSFVVEYEASVVTVVLSYYDFTRLRTMSDLLKVPISRVILMLDAGSVSDIAGNKLSSASLTHATSIMDFDHSPSLLAIQYNSTAHALTVYFSDVINVSLVDLSGFILVAGPVPSPFPLVPLSSIGASVLSLSSSNTNALIISIPADASAPSGTLLLSKIGLLHIQSSTYLYISKAGSVVDISPKGNQIEAMPLSLAMVDGQTLFNFRLDMSDGSISLECPYPGYLAGVKISPKGISISGMGADLGPAFYTLTGIESYSVSDSIAAGTVLTVYLTPSDFSAVDSQFLPQLSGLSLIIYSTAVTDSRSFSLSSDLVLHCRQFVRSNTPPSLVSYALNMNAGDALRISRVIDFEDVLILQFNSHRKWHLY